MLIIYLLKYISLKFSWQILNKMLIVKWHKIYMEKKIMHWLDVEEIASQLEENYHDEYDPNMKLLDLQQMITSLSDFEDHEVEVQRATLEEIRDQWKEIREEFNEEDTD